MSENTNQPVSSLEQFRQEANKRTVEGENVVLPSGLVLKLKRPSLSLMIRDDKVPGNLLNAAIRVAQQRQAQNKGELSETVKLMEFLLIESIVEPVGITAQDIENLSDEDKGEAFVYIQGGTKALDKFRIVTHNQDTPSSQ